MSRTNSTDQSVYHTSRSGQNTPPTIPAVLQGKRVDMSQTWPVSVPIAADSGLVDAKVVAEFLGVSRDWVYLNSVRLGGRRLGSGPRARLRFSLVEALEALTTCPSGKESSKPESGMVERRRRSAGAGSLGSGVDLLPIRGGRAA